MPQLLWYLKLKEVKSRSDPLLFTAPHTVGEGIVRCCACSCILSPGTVTNRKTAAVSWESKRAPRVCICGAGGSKALCQLRIQKHRMSYAYCHPCADYVRWLFTWASCKEEHDFEHVILCFSKHKWCPLSVRKLPISPCINMSLLAVLLNEILTCICLFS